jgi:hypothetical protein
MELSSDDVKKFERYIRTIADDTESNVLEFDDLCQVGREAVMIAAKYFDENRSSWECFAKLCIKQKIREAAQEFYGPFRLPKNVLLEATEIRRPDGDVEKRFPWRKFGDGYKRALRMVRAPRDWYAFDLLVAPKGPSTGEELSMAVYELTNVTSKF